MTLRFYSTRSCSHRGCIRAEGCLVTPRSYSRRRIESDFRIVGGEKRVDHGGEAGDCRGLVALAERGPREPPAGGADARDERVHGGDDGTGGRAGAEARKREVERVERIGLVPEGRRIEHHVPRERAGPRLDGARRHRDARARERARDAEPVIGDAVRNPAGEHDRRFGTALPGRGERGDRIRRRRPERARAEHEPGQPGQHVPRRARWRRGLDERPRSRDERAIAEELAASREREDRAAEPGCARGRLARGHVVERAARGLGKPREPAGLRELGEHHREPGVAVEQLAAEHVEHARAGVRDPAHAVPLRAGEPHREQAIAELDRDRGARAREWPRRGLRGRAIVAQRDQAADQIMAPGAFGGGERGRGHGRRMLADQHHRARQHELAQRRQLVAREPAGREPRIARGVRAQQLGGEAADHRLAVRSPVGAQLAALQARRAGEQLGQVGAREARLHLVPASDQIVDVIAERRGDRRRDVVGGRLAGLGERELDAATGVESATVARLLAGQPEHGEAEEPRAQR